MENKMKDARKKLPFIILQSAKKKFGKILQGVLG
jgi:hypothetical protein